MSCTTPIPDAALVDLVAGELDPAEADALEAHLFACDACARRWEALGALAEGVRMLVRGGALVASVVDGAVVARLRADGARLREYTVTPDAPIACSVGARDDYVVTWFRGEAVATVPSATLTLSRDGVHVFTFADCPIDHEAGALVTALAGDLVRTFPDSRIAFTLAHEDRVVARYELAHSATPPPEDDARP